MIKSVYKGGSSVILNAHKDIDYFYYCETNDERKELLVKNKDRTVDNHYVLWEKRLKIFLVCYSYPFMEHVKGEEIKEFKTFNICDHKKEYKEIAEKQMLCMGKDSKKWYHLYIACCMFERGKNEISDDERNVAQSIHDNGINDEQLEWIKQVLAEIE